MARVAFCLRQLPLLLLGEMIFDLLAKMAENTPPLFLEVPMDY